METHVAKSDCKKTMLIAQAVRKVQVERKIQVAEKK